MARKPTTDSAKGRTANTAAPKTLGAASPPAKKTAPAVEAAASKRTARAPAKKTVPAPPPRPGTGAERAGPVPPAPPGGRVRAVIEAVKPEVDAGRFPIKRVLGERVAVEADVFADGHDQVAADLLYRFADVAQWQRVPMAFVENDRWRAGFTVERLGCYRYTVQAWVDHFATWRSDLVKRAEAGQDLTVPFAQGVELIRKAAKFADPADAAALHEHAERLQALSIDPEQAYPLARSEELAQLVRRNPDPDTVADYARELEVVVDPERACFSTWYEMFPRSASNDGTRHGTFKDVEAWLPYIAGMGFDVLYLPPIHPIGRSFRKGKNNAIQAQPDDVGSPWAIGAEEGGHKAVHPQLGTLADFRRLVRSAAAHGLQIALDIAFQASPDHPYVKEHPQWFLKSPDGSIQYAENPPKKYQDIYPFYFESDDWPALWAELKSVFEFWIEQGVSIFRVDNPHTKPFAFWEWCINELKCAHPQLIFLSEAFTRPKVMHRLAKLGFTQSYTYFTWRNTRAELTEYFTELAHGEGREYFRPNAWPNTPDILHEYLQFGGRPAFVVRLILAATLSANYGIYGPAFELWEHRPRESGSEEYLDSEKYQLRQWDLDDPTSLKELIALVNSIRRRYPALQRNAGLRFHETDNDQLIAYSKHGGPRDDVLLMVVNLDPYHVQSGWLTLPLSQFGLDERQPYQVEDLISGASYLWNGPTNFVKLDPHGQSAHIFRLRGKALREQDFDYYQ